jgi:hypothetical protein
MNSAKWITVDCCTPACRASIAIPYEPPRGGSQVQTQESGWTAVAAEKGWRYHCPAHKPGRFPQAEPKEMACAGRFTSSPHNILECQKPAGHALPHAHNLVEWRDDGWWEIKPMEYLPNQLLPSRLGDLMSREAYELWQKSKPFECAPPITPELIQEAADAAAKSGLLDRERPEMMIGWDFSHEAAACRCAVCGVDIVGSWSNAGQLHGPMGDLPLNGGDDEFLALCPVDYRRVADFARSLRRLPEGQTGKGHPRDLTSDWDVLPDAD